MSNDAPAYGPWGLVILNSAVFLMFAFSFFKPQTARDWRSFGAFAAFVMALFVEMYGFPLTVYLLSGWLQTRYPGLDILSHDAGHLWSTLLGEKGDPHFGVLHIASYVLLGTGFWLLSSAWNVLYHAQRRQALAVAGPYARIRHPQYVAFVMILLGFLLQWPTLLTLLMFPILVVMYARLARNEEADMRARFGEAYELRAADASLHPVTDVEQPRQRDPRVAMKSAYGRHAEASAVLAATPAAAFAFLDDHRRLSSHMESSSMMMAGSAMKIETDEFRGQEIGSRIRTAGHALGLALAVEQVVIERDPPWRKTWETVGQPRLLVIGAYRMGFVVQPDAAGSRVTVWIDYAPPKGNALLGRLFGRVYARWCTARMAHDAAARLEPAAPQVWRQ